MDIETVPIAELKPHPRNYRAHPADQLEHIIESIKEHGVYRNVVIARDGTILAGHGVVEALRKMGDETVAVHRLDVDPGDPRALKLLTGDNELAHLGEVNDRLLTELLREVKDADEMGLVGTGYDEMMLANLVYVTRPASEIATFNEATQWVGMPEYEDGERSYRLTILFRSEEDRLRCLALLDLAEGLEARGKGNLSTWWPPAEKEDISSIRYKVADETTIPDLHSLEG